MNRPSLDFRRLSPVAYARTRADRIRTNLRDPRARVVTLAGLAGIGVLVLVLVYWIVVVAGLPSARDIRAARYVEATILYTHDGEPLSTYSDKNRTWVPLDSIAPVMVDALVATEDHRFFEHGGIDLRRLFSSAGRTLAGDAQGGSTITMQLARNAFTALQDDFVLTRKLREWLLALSIEGRYRKEDILEMYLNTVPFMYNAFGVEAAAQTYYGKGALDLDLDEAATLVGMLKATVYYNPVRNPERSQTRRNVVYGQMVKWGYLPADTLDLLRETPTELHFQRLTRDDYLAPHFAEAVRQELDAWAEAHGHNLYRDGLRVYTTLDSRLQKAAESAVQQEGQKLEEVSAQSWGGTVGEPYAALWQRHDAVLTPYLRRNARYRTLRDAGLDENAALDSLRRSPVADSLRRQLQRVEAGFAAIDPHTGAVRAWVGGRSYGANQFDHVADARRQPGSTFKPFVYGAALENGLSPYDAFPDEVRTYRDAETGQAWQPRNSGGTSGGMMTLRDALAYSKNTVTARVITEVGPEKVAALAHRMGIQSDLVEVPSLGLGTSEVTLLEMVSAYATLADGGRYRAPRLISRIEDAEGNLLETFAPAEPVTALDAQTSYTLLDMLRGVIQRGTGTRLRGYAKGDLAGKTGTTQNGADGWFMLAHPDLAMGAWVGFDTPSITFRSSYYGQGAHTALPIVGAFLKRAQQLAPDVVSANARFEPPSGYAAPVAPPVVEPDSLSLDGIEIEIPDSLNIDDVYAPVEEAAPDSSGAAQQVGRENGRRTERRRAGGDATPEAKAVERREQQTPRGGNGRG